MSSLRFLCQSTDSSVIDTETEFTFKKNILVRAITNKCLLSFPLFFAIAKKSVWRYTYFSWMKTS